MEKGTSEITKLTERISKDPKSKLFVPLAEEYKKAGDIETAIAVLMEGLKNNPGYVTAKSFLGRLLLDKGDLVEAQKEFEEVIKAIPDNVLAQRKLGNIHVLQGRAQEALLFFKAVLAVNPKDPELKALVADIEAGRDVRGKIEGPKYQPAAGQVAAAVPKPGPPPTAAPIPPVKPSAAPAVMPKPHAASVGIPPSVAAEEPEEVFVFESLDEVPVGALLRPEATQDMFAVSAPEAAHEEAARMDDGLTGGKDSRLVDTDRSAAAVTEHESGSPDAGPVNSFFDSEPALIDIPAADSGGFDVVAAPELSALVTEHALDSPDAGLPDNSFFDVEPVETEAEPRTSRDREDGEEPTLVTPDVPADRDSFVPDEASSDSVLFDVKPIEEAQLSAQVSDSGLEVAAEDEAVPFGETLPEADDFTTDTLAELYIAQGFYEKAIEIYERMLADRPNSKLLKDKLANVRAMGSASSADEEQGTPVFFEAPGSPPVPSSQPLSAGVAKQWKAPGVEVEAMEYIPPPPDDFESTAFGSGFAPVEYVQPEAPDALPPFPAEQTLPDEKQVPATSKTAASGREQTIARLDTWLKNIKKEK